MSSTHQLNLTESLREYLQNGYNLESIKVIPLGGPDTTVNLFDFLEKPFPISDKSYRGYRMIQELESLTCIYYEVVFGENGKAKAEATFSPSMNNKEVLEGVIDTDAGGIDGPHITQSFGCGYQRPESLVTHVPICLSDGRRRKITIELAKFL